MKNPTHEDIAKIAADLGGLASAPNRQYPPARPLTAAEQAVMPKPLNEIYADIDEHLRQTPQRNAAQAKSEQALREAVARAVGENLASTPRTEALPHGFGVPNPADPTGKR
jgi:hypothetical protein